MREGHQRARALEVTEVWVQPGTGLSVEVSGRRSGTAFLVCRRCPWKRRLDAVLAVDRFVHANGGYSDRDLAGAGEHACSGKGKGSA